MRFRLLWAFVCAVSTPAFAGNFDLHFQTHGAQTVRAQNGTEVVDSHAERSSIRLIPTDEENKKRAIWQVVVMNHGPRAFDFGPDNFKARLDDGTEIPVVSYEQLRHEEKNRRTWRRIAAGIAAMGNSGTAANAGYSSGTVNYKGTSYGADGITQTYGRANWTAYDPARSQEAQAIASDENQRIFASMADRNARGMAALQENLRRTTVDPDGTFGGQIVLDLPQSVRKAELPVHFTVAVTIDGEVHTIGVFLAPLDSPRIVH